MMLFTDDRLYKTADGHAALMAWYSRALDALPVAYQSSSVETRHGRTHVLTLGDADKPPLVMIQGFGASAPLWKNQFPDLAAHYRLYALDVPGHPGRSEPRVLSLLDSSYAEWLVDALDALRLERAHVAGVCLGGWIAMQTAVYAPERIEKLVLLSPVGLAPFKVFVRSGVPLILNFGRDTEAAGERLLRMAFAPPGSNLSFDRDLARALTLVIRHYDIAAIAGLDGQHPTARDLLRALRTLGRFVRPMPDAALRRIAAPTLLLVGQHEAIYDPHAAVARAEKYIPNVTAEIVARSGHATIYDRPDYVNPRILEFLTGG